jgi:hypothetical protein
MLAHFPPAFYNSAMVPAIRVAHSLAHRSIHCYRGHWQVPINALISVWDSINRNPNSHDAGRYMFK